MARSSRGSRLQRERGAPNGLLLNVVQFNKLVPVGTYVRYYPVAGEPEHRDTQTRSQAWDLGSGDTVVLIVGQAGGVLVSHLELLEQP